MIVTEYFRTRSDGVRLVRTYSDEGRWITQDNGMRYAEAIDVEGHGYTYTETDEYVDGQPETIPAEEALAELLEVLE